MNTRGLYQALVGEARNTKHEFHLQLLFSATANKVYELCGLLEDARAELFQLSCSKDVDDLIKRIDEVLK